MKKVSLILAAFALVLGLSQCKKQETPAQSGENQHIVLMASNGNDGSKVSGSFNSETPAVLDLTWEKGDKISVSGGATSEQPLTLKTGENSPSATFEGDITKYSDDDIVFTVGNTPENFEDQTGTAEACATWIQEHNHFVGTSDYQESGNYNVQMNLQYAVLKLDVSALGTSGAMTIAVGGSTVASVTDVSSSAGKAVFVAVPADGTQKTYTISCGDKIGVKTWTLAKNMFYTAAGEGGTPTGEAIVITPTPNKFSVGSNTTVEFAMGNLWYNPSDLKFYFEDNQWDFAVGSYQDNDPLERYHDWVPNHVSHFYWSKTASVAYENEYNDSNLQETDVFFTNQDGFTVNGETGWRTLSFNEWEYLLGCVISGSSQRTDKSYRPDATNKCAWKELTDERGTHYGHVILPDDVDADVMSSILKTDDLATYGAAFLPAAGYRENAMVYSVGTIGFYWSNTLYDYDSKSAGELTFYNPKINLIPGNDLSNGLSVRLVR